MVTTAVEALQRNVNDVDVVHGELQKHVGHKIVHAKETSDQLLSRKHGPVFIKVNFTRKKEFLQCFSSSGNKVSLTTQSYSTFI